MNWKVSLRQLIHWPVHQKQLHEIDIDLIDVILKRASLFPFFDRQGTVHAHMLVWPKAPWIVMLDARDVVISSRPTRLDIAFGELQNLHDDRFDRYRNLWHYDPWWLLADPRFTGHRAVPVLKNTNAVEPLEHCTYAGYFTRDLSEAVGDVSKFLPARAALHEPGRSERSAWRVRQSWPLFARASWEAASQEAASSEAKRS